MISGELKGRKLCSIKGSGTRPTADRVRESVFNILSDGIRESTVLDLFAGTGALGIEALSRGARYAVFLENNINAINIIHQNVKLCHIENRTKIIQWNIVKSLRCMTNFNRSFDFIFMDPPYNLGVIEATLVNISRQIMINHETVIIVEHSNTETIPESLSPFRLSDQRTYGNSLVSFLECVI